MRPLSELPKKERCEDLLQMALIRLVGLMGQFADHDPLIQALRAELAGGGMSGYTRYMAARQRLNEMYQGASK